VTNIQTLTDGIAVGALYALIALGYTLVYGILSSSTSRTSDVFAWGVDLIRRCNVDGRQRHQRHGHADWYVGLAVLLAAMIFCGVVGF
jgi:branched-chain amino acid transport system permease protein